MANANNLRVLDLHNADKIGDEQEKKARHCTQHVAPRKLADISNLPIKPRSIVQDGKPRSIQRTANEYIEKLQKENVHLVKMLEQRNKIIEQSGIELDRMRVNMIKLQEQNRQIALSHSQMLGEVNSYKDLAKTARHELCCMRALQKTRKPEPEDKAATHQCRNEDAELVEQGELSKEVREEQKPHNIKRRPRSWSLGTSEPLQSEENSVNRPLVRRQSARFKAMASKQAEVMLKEVATATELPEIPPLPNEQENRLMTVREESMSVMLKEVATATELPEIPPLPNEQENRVTSETEESESVMLDEVATATELPEILPLPNEQENRLTSEREESKSVNRKRSFHSVGLSSSELLHSEENAKNKRPYVRRQSSRFKAVESQEAEASSAVDDDQLSRVSPPVEAQEMRPSLGRPSRSSKKVVSYKEIPVNIKMRRPF